MQTLSENEHNFVKKTKNYVKKTEIILRNYIQISPKKGKKKCLLGMCHVGIFCQNLTRYQSKNYSKF